MDCFQQNQVRLPSKLIVSLIYHRRPSRSIGLELKTKKRKTKISCSTSKKNWVAWRKRLGVRSILLQKQTEKSVRPHRESDSVKSKFGNDVSTGKPSGDLLCTPILRCAKKTENIMLAESSAGVSRRCDEDKCSEKWSPQHKKDVNEVLPS